MESLSAHFRWILQYLWMPLSLPRVGATIWGFPDFGYLVLYRPQTPYQRFGAQGCNLALHHWDLVIQGCQELIAMDITASSNSVPTGIPLQSQDIVLRVRYIPGCLSVIAVCLSRPNQPINSLHSKITTWIFELWDFLQWTCMSKSTTFCSPSSCLRSWSHKHWWWMHYHNLGRLMFPFLNKVIQKLLSYSGRGDHTDSSLVAISAVVFTSDTNVCV